MNHFQELTRQQMAETNGGHEGHVHLVSMICQLFSGLFSLFI